MTLRPRAALAICAGLLVVFGSLAWSAAVRESATYDETVHSFAVFASTKLHDYRINVEHPVLWKYWAGLPELFADDFHVDTQEESWRLAPVSRKQQTAIVQQTLYHTPGNATEHLLNRSRFMMMLLGVLLGAVIGWWAFRLAGTVAALGAVLLYAFDPNFLAHAPLVTNDVAMSLVFCTLMFATWRMGQAATSRRVALVAVLCGVAVTTKYSALICGPVVALLLLWRAWMDRPWEVLGRVLSTRRERVARVVLLCLAFAATAYVSIWASYGFRYGIATDPSVHMDLQRDVTLEAKFHLIAQHPGVRPTDEQAAAYPTGLFMRTMLALARHRILPEPYIDGLMYVHANEVIRRTFLLGDVTILGTWAYFPVAMLVKTPTATMISVLIALAMFVAWRPWAQARSTRAWDAVCLAVPPLVYFAFALKANLNLGLRHVFPVYPFLFIGAGIAGAKAMLVRPRIAVGATAVLGAALIAESVAAFPNYLPFFNTPSGGSRGGLGLLGDSNLDWGQGLKALHEWQVQHAGVRMGLAYFGSADPGFYGVDAERLAAQGRNGFELRIAPGTEVTAISASMLQAILLDPDSQRVMGLIRDSVTPFDVVAASIYLYKTADIVAVLDRVTRAN